MMRGVHGGKYYDFFKAILCAVRPYAATIMKQISGRTKETLTAGMPAIVPQSMIIPCSGGMSAPPTMAITRNAAPNEVSRS